LTATFVRANMLCAKNERGHADGAEEGTEEAHQGVADAGGGGVCGETDQLGKPLRCVSGGGWHEACIPRSAAGCWVAREHSWWCHVVVQAA